ncbi:MAG TPA: prolyl oligopeptidase family serine peptidase [Gemmatimonadaceae bacterium]|jgi:dipeptidyl aminopeptidase/acylaminoacyl peptidase
MSRRASLALVAGVAVASAASAQVSPFHTSKPRAIEKPATAGPTLEQFMSPPSPLEFGASRKTERLAWVTYERGMRNIYTAAAPDWTAKRITSFLNDDGVDVGSVRLSDDGTVAIFVRGAGQNRVGWSANPSHDPNGPDRAVWAAKTDGTGAWRLGSIMNTELAGGGRGGGAPELSPDGKHVIFVRDGQIFHARIARGATSAMDTAGVAFIKEWGRQSAPTWSPDGSKIAFVSTRDNHSFIGLYDMAKRTVNFLSPSVDFDASPSWSPDGKQIAFTRKPGTPFGAQSQQGTGGIGSPAGAAAGRGAGRGEGAAAPGGSGGRGGRGGGRGGRGGDDEAPGKVDGLYRAAFPDGSTLQLMTVDITTGKSQTFWHNKAGDRTFGAVTAIRWAGDHVVFTASPPNDEWDRWYSLPITGSPTAEPTLLTTTDGLINDGVADRTFVTTTTSRDGKTFYYATNAKDIEKRHIWSVPVAGGTPKMISTDAGVEVSPTLLPSGKIAVLYFGATQPASIGLVPAEGGATKILYPTAAQMKDFPQAAHVEPSIVITKAADGTEVHNQLFLPKDLKPGEKRPAIVFVHGGPSRQMLPAYHYMQFYHWAYGFNEYLASQGYVVMSINYRSGIGYGNSFRRAPNTEARGNSEYQDVIAGGKYLQSRADVDPARVGIWGLSYGGLLTSQALARNSDVFVAGVDMAGVHLYGSSLDSTALSYTSSSSSHIDTWKSPVYLVQGDDDRNVDFSQTIGLVQLLRAHGIYYELTVNPDDVHESLIHGRWVDVWNHSADFLKRFVWDKQTPPVMSSMGKH